MTFLSPYCTSGLYVVCNKIYRKLHGGDSTGNSNLGTLLVITAFNPVKSPYFGLWPMKHLGDFLTNEATLTRRMRVPEYSSVEVWFRWIWRIFVETWFFHWEPYYKLVWFPDPSCMGGTREGRKGLVNNSTPTRITGCIPAVSVDEGKSQCQVGVSRE